MTEKELIEAVRKHLETMTDEKRHDLMLEMFCGYCKHCGRETDICYCTRDD